MKKIIALVFLFLLFKISFGQQFNNNVQFNKTARFVGKTELKDTMFYFIRGADTCRMGIINHYFMCDCSSEVDSIHFSPAVSGGGGAGVNIYNSDGTLTGDRLVDGNGHDISFNNNGIFSVGAFFNDTRSINLYGTNSITEISDTSIQLGCNKSIKLNGSIELQLNAHDTISIDGSGLGGYTIPTKSGSIGKVLKMTSTHTATWANDSLTTSIDTSSITNFGLKTRTLFSANSPSTYNNVTGKIGTDTSVVATKYYVDQSPTSCTPYISVRDSIHGCGSGLFINDSNGIGIISPAFTINSAIINNNILNGYFQLYSTNYGDGLFNVNASIGQVIIGDGAADVNNTNIVVTDVIKDVEITADSILLHNAVQPIVAADGVTQDVVITSTGKLAQKNSIERIEWYSVGADSTHIQIAGTSDSGLYRVNAYLNTQDMDAAAGNVDLYIDWVDPNGISQELFIQECVLSQQNFNSVLYPYPIVIKKNGSGNIEIKTEIIIAGYGSATYNLTIVTEKL